MTTITYYKKNNLFLGFEVKGHTGKDDFGKDLLCCQISTVAQMAILAFREPDKVAEFAEISDGYLKVMLSEENAKNDKYQFFFIICYESFKSIIIDEKKYAKLEVKNV